jgi:predicted chitinase
MKEFSLDTYVREAIFLAQIAHESGEFRWMKEIWGPTAAQKRYEPPSSLAAKLGNTKKGDGKRYMGRGVIQLTGRFNYRKYGSLLGVDLENNPELAEKPELAFRTAGLYWKIRNINEPTDRRDIVAVTKLINGGTNGLEDRQKYYNRALLVLSKNDNSPTPPPASLKVFVDEKDVTALVKQFRVDGRVMVALRPITTKAGLAILSVGGGEAIVRSHSGQNVSIPVVVKDGTGYVLLRDLPLPLDWDAETATATISTD